MSPEARGSHVGCVKFVPLVIKRTRDVAVLTGEGLLENPGKVADTREPRRASTYRAHSGVPPMDRDSPGIKVCGYHPRTPLQP